MLKGFKTVILGVALVLLAALNNPDVQAFIHNNLAVVEGSLGGLIIALRMITTSSIFKS